MSPSAVTVTGTGTLVGSTGNDTITAGGSPVTIWGLGGSDNITAGGGMDVIDGGGTCPPGLAPGDYPNGLPGTNYCQHGPSGTFGTDTITAGGGEDTVFAFGGPNIVTVGNGEDTIFAYGTGIYTTGTGRDTINAQFSTHDTITCGSKHSTVFAVKDGGDTITNCTVKFVSQQPVPGQSSSARRLAKTGRTAAVKSAA